jgi:hypothetical protein
VLPHTICLELTIVAEMLEAYGVWEHGAWSAA